MNAEIVVKILQNLCLENWENDFGLKYDISMALKVYLVHKVNKLPDMTEEEKMMVLEENKIGAIKAYRDRTGLTLSNAKDKVDDYSNQVYDKLYRPKILGRFED
jgi:ribosomal protein L7/L12